MVFEGLIIKSNNMKKRITIIRRIEYDLLSMRNEIRKKMKSIYTIIAIGPLFVCVCVCLSVCGRTPPRPVIGSTSFLAQMSSTHPGLYRFFC